MTRSQLRALGITLFPVLLAVGIPTIPVVSDYSDHALAAQAASNTVRWFWGHGISAVAFGFAILASCLIADHLYHKGEGVDIVGPAFVAMGAALYAAGLGADGIAPVSILAAGGQPEVFFDGSGPWVGGTFVAAAAAFGIGLISQVVGLLRARVLVGAARGLALAGAIVFVVGGAIPSGWGLYLVSAAAFAVYVPISAAVWQDRGDRGS